MNPGSALVVGATGYTGRAVVQLLAASGSKCVAHVRPDSRRGDEVEAEFLALGVQVDRTPWESHAMTSAIRRQNPATIYALLGTTVARMAQARRRGRNESYASVDRDLTLLLLHAAIRTEFRGRFVYLSTAGVQWGIPTPYPAARRAVEAELKLSGIEYTIARPSIITGPGRAEPRPFERAGAAVLDTLLRGAGRLGAGHLRDRFLSTTNTALALALVRAAHDRSKARAVVESDELRRLARAAMTTEEPN